MQIDHPSALLGGLSPAQFMRRHWQRRPLVVRGAWPGVKAPLPRAELLALAADDGVESRLVRRDGSRWSLQRGPFARRALPSLKHPLWTLLVQGMDLHVDGARAMLEPFRFVTDARLDDLMISFATDGGGVGPHVDPYDVFLIQLEGRRRWRLGPAKDRRLVADAPLKLLQHFEPTQDIVLEPGDLLYLPPMWGHDGIAVGTCMTASVGFRAPTRQTIVREVLPLLADALPEAASWDGLYRDAGESATATPGRVPQSLERFARAAWQRVLGEPGRLAQALGQWLTEPKAQVWFDAGSVPADASRPLRLDRRSRMMYDLRHVYLNGEAFTIAARDLRVMRKLADRRELSIAERGRLGSAARALIDQWAEAGWLHEL
ncbi:MAG: cupin domain-containing protein [Burkholderiaceae bacterium]